MIYAGKGSRETPREVCNRFYLWGAYLHASGHLLRSGSAQGADKAFENGCDSLNIAYPKKQIFTAQQAVTRGDWLAHAAKHHPKWRKCAPYHKLLHARNSAIMLGHLLDTPVDCVLCWTKDGGATGGTGQALRIAGSLNIPVFNWYFPHAESSLRAWLGV